MRNGEMEKQRKRDICTDWQRDREIYPFAMRLLCSSVAKSTDYIFNKMSFFELIKFITEDCFTNYRNITTKLNRRSLTKVIKRPSKEGLGLDRQSVLIKR